MHRIFNSRNAALGIPKAGTVFPDAVIPTLAVGKGLLEKAFIHRNIGVACNALTKYIVTKHLIIIRTNHSKIIIWHIAFPFLSYEAPCCCNVGNRLVFQRVAPQTRAARSACPVE